MLFETHAHYDDEAFAEDRETILKELPEKGVGRVVNISSDLASCRSTMALTEQYPYIYGAMGVHPCSVKELDEAQFAWLKSQCSHPRCVAVGEIGLDYYWDKSESDLQKYWFVRQLRLAAEVGLPVVIHSREAAKDTLDILKEEGADRIGGVIHCYSYTKETALDYLRMGFFFGIGGALTFKNNKKLKEAVEYIPMDRIVLETDSPYLAPVPFRGKRNCSLYLSYVADTLAQIKGISREEVERITWENACRLYRMPADGI